MPPRCWGHRGDVWALQRTPRPWRREAAGLAGAADQHPDLALTPELPISPRVSPPPQTPRAGLAGGGGCGSCTPPRYLDEGELMGVPGLLRQRVGVVQDPCPGTPETPVRQARDPGGVLTCWGRSPFAARYYFFSYLNLHPVFPTPGRQRRASPQDKVPLLRTLATACPHPCDRGRELRWVLARSPSSTVGTSTVGTPPPRSRRCLTAEVSVRQRRHHVLPQPLQGHDLRPGDGRAR